ncbi:putative methyltransferase [Sphingomonas changbaiensis NBRC 104936]|uniref:Putative methyltransferase n=1 Tax=Sphingomonas changbaiensis NBRC 104936 TaxID=1219043 RepID=A0A0E9MQ82_9SPHN|nr:class I SAM-dependent methyltransferase [Sphingomonas changbaiensis]GAO39709.1 putative methyltransferase [Sphingomonas changbaiensis NBRC 104936]
MTAIRDAANEQGINWNGQAGYAWVEAQDLLDRLFTPIEGLLANAAEAASARRVLDVGCGTGSTTRAIARLPGVRCVGIDISEPMLALARRQAEANDLAARFLCGDAQSYGFEAGSFDMIVSRFGVMFFDDPVKAFANLRRAARPGASLRIVAWRSADENPFMTVAERAAAPFLPNLPARTADGPGQFAFADPDRVHRILEESGWKGIDIQPLDVPCTMPEGDLVRYFTLLGPLGRVLGEVDGGTRARIVDAVRAAFDPFVQGADVRFTAACWTIGAKAPA